MDWMENWFSNFIPFDKPMAHNGLLYSTPEHFYAAMKTMDKDVRAQIAALKYPGQAKKKGQMVSLRRDWEQVKESVMWTAIRWKFRHGTEAAKQLLSTESWDIVEWNNWHDNYWGCCICPRCRNKTPLNRLGVLLMEQREKLQQ